MDTVPPGKSAGREIVERTVEAALSSVPLVGAALSVTFVTALGWRLERRRAEWFTRLAEGLEDVRHRIGDIDFEMLADNPSSWTLSSRLPGRSSIRIRNRRSRRCAIPGRAEPVGLPPAAEPDEPGYEHRKRQSQPCDTRQDRGDLDDRRTCAEPEMTAPAATHSIDSDQVQPRSSLHSRTVPLLATGPACRRWLVTVTAGDEFTAASIQGPVQSGRTAANRSAGGTTRRWTPCYAVGGRRVSRRL